MGKCGQLLKPQYMVDETLFFNKFSTIFFHNLCGELSGYDCE